MFYTEWNMNSWGFHIIAFCFYLHCTKCFNFGASEVLCISKCWLIICHFFPNDLSAQWGYRKSSIRKFMHKIVGLVHILLLMRAWKHFHHHSNKALPFKSPSSRFSQAFSSHLHGLWRHWSAFWSVASHNQSHDHSAGTLRHKELQLFSGVLQVEAAPTTTDQRLDEVKVGSECACFEQVQSVFLLGCAHVCVFTWRDVADVKTREGGEWELLLLLFFLFLFVLSDKSWCTTDKWVNVLFLTTGLCKSP